MTQNPKVRDSIRAIRTLAFTVAMVGSLSAANATVTYSIANGGLESFNVSIDGTSINGAWAGGILIQQTQPTDPSLPASYVTVCTDIGGTLYLGQAYTYDGPTAFAGQTGVDPTWGVLNTPAYLRNNAPNTANAAQAIQNAAYLFYTYNNALTVGGLGGAYASQSLTTQRAALQLAIWAALYNTSSSGAVTGNRFSVTGGDATAIADANNWLTALDGNYGLTGYLLYPTQSSAVNTDGNPPQELLIGTPVPEAPTVIAGVLLLLPFAASTFKILRKKHITK